MTDNITAIPVSTKVPDGSIINAKPCHLVCLLNGKSKKMFIALERPIMEGAAWVQVKGFFVEHSEDTIVAEWQSIVKNVSEDKSNIKEFYFPWLKVDYIQNLVYNANKSK